MLGQSRLSQEMSCNVLCVSLEAEARSYGKSQHTTPWTLGLTSLRSYTVACARPTISICLCYENMSSFTLAMHSEYYLQSCGVSHLRCIQHIVYNLVVFGLFLDGGGLDQQCYSRNHTPYWSCSHGSFIFAHTRACANPLRQCPLKVSHSPAGR